MSVFQFLFYALLDVYKVQHFNVYFRFIVLCGTLYCLLNQYITPWYTYNEKKSQLN